MLSSGMQCYHLELMLSSGTKCYHLKNVIMVSSGANVIIWILVLSCDVIIWDDNTPLFCFSWKLHSLIVWTEATFKLSEMRNHSKDDIFLLTRQYAAKPRFWRLYIANSLNSSGVKNFRPTHPLHPLRLQGFSSFYPCISGTTDRYLPLKTGKNRITRTKDFTKIFYIVFFEEEKLGN